MRTPNTKCFVCQKAIYRSPAHLSKTNHSYCSGKCQKEALGESKTYICENCDGEFKSKTGRRIRKYCSRICSNIGRKGIKYKGGSITDSERHLLVLKTEFNFTSCMVEGCDYNKTYDIHRLIRGIDGGQYIIGNMFAICPNHHAECHRKICKLEKIDNSHLKAVYNTEGHTDWRREQA